MPVTVADAADLPPGAMLTVTVDDRPVVVANVAGTLVAVDGACPHAAGPLGEGELVDGCQLRCPWHGATFDLRTGAVCSGPARKALRRYRVAVEAGAVRLAAASP